MIDSGSRWLDFLLRFGMLEKVESRRGWKRELRLAKLLCSWIDRSAAKVRGDYALLAQVSNRTKVERAEAGRRKGI